MHGAAGAGCPASRAPPQTQVVIDHLGLPQPQASGPGGPFADLSKLLALATHANVAVKISGACTLSHAPFPYPDIGSRWRASSTRSASTAACGAPTGPARSRC